MIIILLVLVSCIDAILDIITMFVFQQYIHNQICCLIFLFISRPCMIDYARKVTKIDFRGIFLFRLLKCGTLNQSINQSDSQSQHTTCWFLRPKYKNFKFCWQKDASTIQFAKQLLDMGNDLLPKELLMKEERRKDFRGMLFSTKTEIQIIPMVKITFIEVLLGKQRFLFFLQEHI